MTPQEKVDAALLSARGATVDEVLWQLTLRCFDPGPDGPTAEDHETMAILQERLDSMLCPACGELHLCCSGCGRLVQDFSEASMHPDSPRMRIGTKIGRNDPCSCGSGQKYKKCCGNSTVQ